MPRESGNNTTIGTRIGVMSPQYLYAKIGPELIGHWCACTLRASLRRRHETVFGHNSYQKGH